MTHPRDWTGRRYAVQPTSCVGAVTERMCGLVIAATVKVLQDHVTLTQHIDSVVSPGTECLQ